MIVLRKQVPGFAVKRALDYVLKVPEDQLLWPVHRFDGDITQLLAYLPAQRGEFCEPQLMVQPPLSGTPAWDNELHIDEPPPWAKGRIYSVIFGVALTPQVEANGGVKFESGAGRYSESLEPGDVIAFGPWEWHTAGRNGTVNPRVAVYFRFLEPSE